MQKNKARHANANKDLNKNMFKRIGNNTFRFIFCSLIIKNVWKEEL